MSSAREVLYAGIGGLALVLAPEVLPFVLIGIGALLLWAHVD